ncbi:molecular chaperone GrpE [Dysgonomonas sp. PH5-45]|uniref:nucleotide exchange factor GrpE n=1 Tax=unclassified Dysgonomonas TaxID=2630389 RepID=UPI002476E1F9|nr:MULTISPECIES: nucleotide exchange factor GrpE [unclassified Dysgonomonas]MDH6356043.1 molecular chaperone GrpE [Dysgonomonas sp. PH5-45]MDH6388936.1 molecular chaperone GrpE [Dysgonomonas sp. PH5-37]
MTDKNKKDFQDQEEFKDENLTNNQKDENLNVEENVNVAEENEDDWQAKYADMNNSYLRLHAEFDNYRKRTIKEKADLIKTGGEKILIDLLPVIDDFERAIENMDKTNDTEAIKEGVVLIYNKFISFLEKHGVKEIETVGQPFDVDKHEALTSVPAQSEDQKDKVIDCVQKGYTLQDKVIRYPKVIVAK